MALSKVDLANQVENQLPQNLVANNLPFRNIIINGDMRIDQRNSGSSVTINATANIYILDRWLGVGQNSDGVFTIEQDTDAPAGFTNCSKITVTTADASIGSTQIYLFSQFIEGNNISYLGFGTSDAKTITLSFWVKSSLTGTFGGAINNSDNSRAYPFTYSISSANTWEKKSVTITGDTSGSGTYPTNNNRGMALRFQIGLGSSQVDTAGAWTASSGIYGATGATNIISTLNATWQITGVQLEAGTTASDFEFLPVDVNLARCQRYYQKSYPQETIPGSAVSTNACIQFSFGTAGTGIIGTCVNLPVVMRASPSGVIYDAAGNSARVTILTTGAQATDNISINTSNSSDSRLMVRIYGTSAAGMLFMYYLSAEL